MQFQVHKRTIKKQKTRKQNFRDVQDTMIDKDADIFIESKEKKGTKK